jgi:hypothetical protein
LIEADVGDGADEIEVADSLAENLVRGGEGDHLFQAGAERDARFGLHELADRLRERHHLVARGEVPQGVGPFGRAPGVEVVHADDRLVGCRAVGRHWSVA